MRIPYVLLLLLAGACGSSGAPSLPEAAAATWNVVPLLARDTPASAAADATASGQVASGGGTSLPVAADATASGQVASGGGTPQPVAPVGEAAGPAAPGAAGQAAPAAPGPAAADAAAVAYTVSENVGTGRSIVWRAFDDVAALKVESSRKVKVLEEGQAEVSYVHPYVGPATHLGTMARRVIAQEFETQNYDMRDAVLIPVPATLTATVPAVEGGTLLFGTCMLDRVFAGNGGGVPQLDVSFEQGGAVTQAASVSLVTDRTGVCTSWAEQSIPLPRSEQGTLTVRFAASGGANRSARYGVAIGGLSVLAPAAGQGGGERSAASHSGPNVLIVFIDAARGDSTGPANTTFPSVTPVVDALARDGVAFVNAFSLSNQTRSSITALLQSQHPTVGGFHSRWWNLKQVVINAYYKSDPPLISRLAKAAGYTTASIGRNHFQFGTTAMALDPAFDLIFDNRRAQEDTVHIIDRASAWLEENRDRKFLLEINISPTHQPYNPPEQYKTWTQARLAGLKDLPARVDYLSELYYADQEVGRLLSRLEALGLREQTVVLITADHGETMHGSHSCNSELFQTICHNSHGLTLYDEEVHVPLIWSVPFFKGLQPAVRSNAVSQADVAPTLLELMGLPPHPRHTGRSLVPDLAGAAAQDEELYFEGRLSSSVRMGGFKYILHHEKDDARTPAWLTGPEGTTQELYDVATDPFETRNVLGRNRAKAEELRSALRRIRTELTNRVRAAAGIPWSPTRASAPASTPAPAPDPSPAPAPSPAPTPGSAPAPAPAPTPGSAPAPSPAPTAGSAPAPAPAPTPDPASAPGAAPAPDPAAAPTPGTAPAPAAASASAPDTGLSARAGARSAGWYYAAFNHARGAAVFGGSISTGGQFSEVEVRGPVPCVSSATGGSLSVGCTVDGDPVFVRFRVTPPDSPVYFDVEMDGRPLRASNLYLGPVGLAVSGDTAIEGPRELELAYSAGKPSFLPGFDPGVFVWHDMAAFAGCASRLSARSDGDFDGPEQIHDSAAKKALQELGYVR